MLYTHENAKGARITQKLVAIFRSLDIRAMQVDFALTGSFTLDTVFETIKGNTSMTTTA